MKLQEVRKVRSRDDDVQRGCWYPRQPRQVQELGHNYICVYIWPSAQVSKIAKYSLQLSFRKLRPPRLSYLWQVSWGPAKPFK